MDESDSPRRPRHTKEEIRQLLMDAGRSLLVEEGLGIAAGGVTFKRALDRVEATTGIRLTNASVIRRVWENQAEFQADVLAAVVAAGDSTGELLATAEAVGPLFELLDRSDPEARLRSLSEVCRVAGQASLDVLVGSSAWALWVGIWVLGATSAPSPANDKVRRALFDGYQLDTEQWGQLHGALAAHVGFRVRAPFTLRQFTVTVGALVEGCALRQVGAEDLAVVLRPTGPDGEQQEWTLFAIGLEALVLQYFELDPEWAPPTDES